MKKHLLIATSLMLSSAMSFGAGYQLNLQGLRQLAMGGSGTALPWDVSTIFYNPGGLTSIDHIQAYANATFIMPNTKYIDYPTGTYSANTREQTFVPVNFYIGAPVSYKSPVSVGLALYTPYGNGLKWDDNWRGRYMIQDIYFRATCIQPTVAYRINDMISVGAGFVYAMGHVELSRAIPITDQNGNDGKAELVGNGHGYGFNVGFQMAVSEKVQLGLSYRSQINMKVKKGSATFTVPQSLATSFPYTTFSSTLPLPQVISFGVGYHVNDDLTLQADVNYTGWAAYDSLVLDFKDNSAALADTRSPRRYKNIVAIRVGGHYVVSDKISVMLGAAWDPTPVRDGFVSPDLPDANRALLTGGLTYKPFEKLTIIGALEYVSGVKRTASFDAGGFSGRYQTKAFTPGIGISYDF